VLSSPGSCCRRRDRAAVRCGIRGLAVVAAGLSREARETAPGQMVALGLWTENAIIFCLGGRTPLAAGLSAWRPASGGVAAPEGLIPFGFLARLSYSSSNSVLGGMPHRGEGMSAAAYSGCWFRRAGEGEAGYESGLEGLDCGREVAVGIGKRREVRIVNDMRDCS
jgi:hypothetical protein